MHVVKHKSGGCWVVGRPCYKWLSLEETSTQTSDEEAVLYMECLTHIHHSDNVDTAPFETSGLINPVNSVTSQTARIPGVSVVETSCLVNMNRLVRKALTLWSSTKFKYRGQTTAYIVADRTGYEWRTAGTWQPSWAEFLLAMDCF
jgi:hypothetical protein